MPPEPRQRSACLIAKSQGLIIIARMIRNRITLKQLEAFAFVVDLGTFRAAASALGTTQPNISARIAALEAAFDIKLLYRDAGSVRLTAKGAALLERSRVVLRAAEGLLEEAGREDLIEERLRLGVTELIACTWLQDFLRRIKERYPSLRVELLVDLARTVDERLLEGQIDLALQNGPFAADLEGQRELAREDYIWVANQQIAASLPETRDVGRFFDFSVLTHAQHTMAGQGLHAMAMEKGLNAQKIVHSSALSACIPMVMEGLGVALLPRSLVQRDLKTGDLIELEADWCAEPLRFFARYDATRAPRFVGRAALIAEQLRPLL